MKVKEKIFIVYLFLFLATANLCACITPAGKVNAKAALTQARLIGVCIKAMGDAVPPEFCTKKGKVYGASTKCPKGTKDRGFWRDSCFKKCKKGYKTDGEKCKKKGKRSYSRVVEKVCPQGMYEGDLSGRCFKDCRVIGMHNCGVKGCALSKDACLSAIINMVIDVTFGLGQLLLFVATSGASSALTAAKKSVRKGLKKIGKYGIRKIAKEVFLAFKSKLAKVFIKTAIVGAQKTVKDMSVGLAQETMKKTIKERAKKGIKDKVKAKVSDLTIQAVSNATVANICSSVYSKMKPKRDKNITKEKVIESLDILNIQNLYKSCFKGKTKHKEDCVKNMLITASNFDPTGLLTIAAAFKHRSCNIPKKLPKPKTDNKIIKPINVKEGCVRMFKHKDFEGKSKTYCKNTKYVGKKDNDHWSSYVLGPDTSVVFFQHSKYKGKSYYTEKKAMSDLSKIGYNDMISSIQISKNENRVVMFRHYNYNGTAWMYTKGQSTKHVGKDQNDQISSIKVGKKVKVKVYEHSKYKGKKKTFTKSTKNVGKKWNDKITSLKVSSK